MQSSEMKAVLLAFGCVTVWTDPDAVKIIP